jgi:tRNA 2-thiouridine synthesizing protein B
MSILHTVNKSAYERDTLESCVRLAAKGASVLLIEDGVYSAMSGGKKSSVIENAKGDLSFYVLGPDVKARGLSEDRLIDGVKVVDYKGFVELTVACDKVSSWL